MTEFAGAMADIRAQYWTEKKVEQTLWPDSAVIFAVMPVVPHQSPDVWVVTLSGERPEITQITNRIYLEGSYESAYSLLYGYRGELLVALGKEAKVADSPIGADELFRALKSVNVLRPIDKLNVRVMPVQDAIDLAYFLATTQVQMERFLPGNPLCGGPIDVMVLSTSPRHEIMWFPGKELRHPTRGQGGVQ